MMPVVMCSLTVYGFFLIVSVNVIFIWIEFL